MAVTYILGISAFYHDSAACLVCDGDICAAAQEERFSRKKHDSRFPKHAVEYCLSEAGITAEDITYVSFYDKPWIKFERLLDTYLSFAPSGFQSFISAMPVWIKEKFWMGDVVKRHLGFDGELMFPEHHQSHAASAFFPSPFKRAAILTIDGVGEWATASWGVGFDNSIELIKELKFPHSLGLLYTAFTYYCGFKVNSGEYKLMGLAPYGRPKYADMILDNVVDLAEDGSLWLDQKYFNYCQGLTMTSHKFHDLFGGAPRKPESPLTQHHMDIASSIQYVTELAMLRMARHVRKETNEKDLCLAGGVALNCVANGKILQEKIFDNLWIQPAAGDAGGALGAALFGWHQVLKNPRVVASGSIDDAQKKSLEVDSQKGSLLGPSFSGDDIEKYLSNKGYPFVRYGEEMTKVVAKAVSDGKVVGWFCGRMEFGPRALGARSIIGDARNSEMQRTMNLKIKYRESFRPFAPIVLREDVSDYFEIDSESPYMLLVAPVASHRRITMTSEQDGFFGIDKLNVLRSDIPAVTHVDYSARIQTVDVNRNPVFYKLLKEFKAITGYSVMVNTSFNVRGEPIVCNPQDAYRCFMRTEMDVLVLEDCVLLKEEQPKWEEDENWRTQYELD